ncbi:SpoIIE family protein phosphatase [Micromonospora siamensis]|uniref:protein-serine/threonine phosphatase n=1 Tax=Micromonospora siamensis TaxID=299152 RepID=A0A1C5HKX8_9ACTN|nr:GAF domain-containing SpoIIE family protein phosphatase [Micromonospora siamensis]SCG46639.1 GAF domain-containing protein [Micromonospora siamensis]
MNDGSRDRAAGRPRIVSPALSDPARLRSLAETGLDNRADEAFDRFARLVSDLLEVPVALVSLVGRDRQFFPGAIGLPEPWAERRQTPLSHSFCQHVVDIEVPMVLPDARLYPRVRDNLAIPDLGVVAYAGMPLTDLEGRVLGALCAIDSKPRAWTARQLRTLADLAAACSSELRLRIALDGAQDARRQTEEAHGRLTMLAEMSETLGGTLDVNTSVERLGHAMVPVLADWCLVTLVDRAGEPRTVSAVHRDPERAAEAARFADLMTTGLGPRSITRSVLRSGQSVLVSAGTVADVAERTTLPEMPALAERLGFASHLSVPITAAGRGAVIGCITLVNGPDRRPFDDGDLHTAQDIGRRAGQAVGNSWMYGEQRHVAEVLQHSMLPALPRPAGVELAARYQPVADRVEVGGDWYDAFVQPDGDLVVAIGDVAGHDIEAAATMGQLRNLVRGNAFGRTDPVAGLLTHLDEAIRGLRIPTVATAVLARLRHADTGGLTLSWCNAGHPPPLLVRVGGAVEVLDAPREPLLGLARPIRRTGRETPLAPGDTLLLYTDGLVERRDRPLDEGLEELVDRLTGGDRLTVDELCDRLVTAVHNREDDIALLAARAH